MLIVFDNCNYIVVIKRDSGYLLVNVYSLLLNMAIEMSDLPMTKW